MLTAQWGGWCVKMFTQDGKPDSEIKVDASQVSCCAFGVADMKTLYITTASIGLQRSSSSNFSSTSKSPSSIAFMMR